MEIFSETSAETSTIGTPKTLKPALDCGMSMTNLKISGVLERSCQVLFNGKTLTETNTVNNLKITLNTVYQ